MNGIYIREKIENGETKIIIANKGRLIETKTGFSFNLYNGTITNIDKKTSFNLNFKETSYGIPLYGSKKARQKKLGETNSFFLLDCLNKNFDKRKNNNLRCGEKSSFLFKDIYEEIFKRIVNPIYIITLSLISSMIIIKAKIGNLQSYYKFFLFTLGFFVIIFSELSYKFIFLSNYIEFLSIILPIIFIILSYLIILIKSRFNFKYL